MSNDRGKRQKEYMKGGRENDDDDVLVTLVFIDKSSFTMLKNNRA